MESLNLGCGGSGKYKFKDLCCSVNADIQRPSTKINNFVLCDAHALPFRKGAFAVVYALHILEHLENPRRAISEMESVASGEVVATFPHVLSANNYIDPTHKWIILRKHFIPIFNPLRLFATKLLKDLNKIFYIFYKRIPEESTWKMKNIGKC